MFQSCLRDVVEGLALILLSPVCWLASRVVNPCGPRAWSRVRPRWAVLARRGLRCQREHWWHSSRLEPLPTTWRHVVLTEAAELAPAAVGATSGMVVALPGHLGDLLHALPLLHAWKAAQPASRLTVLAGPWAKEIVEREGVADEVITWRPQLWQYHRGQARHRMGFWSEARALGKLRARRFDTLITPGVLDPASWLLVRAIRPRRWLGVGPIPGDFAALEDERLAAYDQTRYEAERLLRAVGPETPPAEAPIHLAWAPAEEARRAAQARLPEWGLPAGARIVVLAPGAGWPGKQWPAERFGELARLLREKCDCWMAVLGSKDERGLGDEVVKAAAGSCVNLAGQTSLLESCGIIGCADLFVGNDSALLHFAALQDTPAVALFGPTSPAQWAPRGKHVRICRATSGCPACLPWHPRARCMDRNPCLGRIGVAEVAEQAEQLLETAR